MVREFYLINETGQTFSLMDINHYCLLTEPEGLGCSYYTEHHQINNSFIPNVKRIEQGIIGGTLNFINYDNYTKFVNFAASAKSLKFQYKIPKSDHISNYYRNVVFKSITKTQKLINGFLSEQVIFEATTLWYEENNFIYRVEEIEDELRWDFEWDSVFTDYENRSVLFDNTGHTEAPFLLEMGGYILNPTISVYRDNELINELSLEITIEEGEKLIYCTRDNECEITKLTANGTKIKLFDSLDLNNDNNFFKLPIGYSTIKLSAENEILNSKLTIYKEYIAV